MDKRYSKNKNQITKDPDAMSSFYNFLSQKLFGAILVVWHRTKKPCWKIANFQTQTFDLLP